MRILVTRPAPDAERTIAALRERGHETLHAPLLCIEAMPEAAIGPGPWDALLLTSANAVRAIEPHPRFHDLTSLHVIAVGPRTAAAAREAGFPEVVSAEGDEASLVARVIAEYQGRNLRFLYLAGEHRAGDIAGKLAACGFQVETVVVYRAAAAGELPPAVVEALSTRTVDAALHYSPRSAETFVKALNAKGLGPEAAQLVHFCLSAQVAAPLSAAGLTNIKVASRPTEEDLLELLSTA